MQYCSWANDPNQLCSKRGMAFAAEKWRAMFAASAEFDLLGAFDKNAIFNNSILT